MWGSLVGIALQGAGALIGQIQSARANRERAMENAKMYSDAKRDADSQRFTDFLNTDNGRALRAAIDDEYRSSYRNLNSNAMRSGMSGEARRSGLDAMGSAYASAYGKLSQAGQSYRQNALSQYNSIMAAARKQKHDDENAMYSDRSKSALALEGNAAKVGAGFIDGDSIGRGEDVTGGSKVGEVPNYDVDLLKGASYL